MVFLGKRKQRRSLGRNGSRRTIIMKRVLVFELEGVKWTGLAEFGDTWISFVNTLCNIY